MLGFQKARLPVEGQSASSMSASGSLIPTTATEEDYYVLMEERIDVREFETVMNIIFNLQETLHTMPPLLFQKADEPSTGTINKQAL